MNLNCLPSSVAVGGLRPPGLQSHVWVRKTHLPRRHTRPCPGRRNCGNSPRRTDRDDGDSARTSARILDLESGVEMANHKSFTISTGIAVYCCSCRPMATWLEREHQRRTAPALPEGKRPLRPRTRGSRTRCPRTRSRPWKMFDWDTPAERLAKIFDEFA